MRISVPNGDYVKKRYWYASPRIWRRGWTNQHRLTYSVKIPKIVLFPDLPPQLKILKIWHRRPLCPQKNAAKLAPEPTESLLRNLSDE